MLHEILLALFGHTGSVFTQSTLGLMDINNIENQPRNIKFQVNATIKFLSQAEQDQLNQLVQLGAMFLQIQQFLDKYSGINSKLALQLALGKDRKESEDNRSDMGDADEDETVVVGVYLKAFCSGVNDLLRIYKQHLLSLEQEYLQERSLTVTTLSLKLQLYF